MLNQKQMEGGMENGIANRRLIAFYNYNQLELPHQQRNHAYERVREESPKQYGSPEREQAEQQLEDEAHLYEANLEAKGDCFPRLLTAVGQCCIPFKILCPCLFCEWCMCKGNLLFEQQTSSLGLLQEWGHFERILSPGLHVINPISQSIIEVSQQTKVIEYSQLAMSKDNVQTQLRVVIFYRVIDCFKLAYRLGSNAEEQCITEIAIAALRSLLGQNQLQIIIESRSIITFQLTRELNRQLAYWGLHVQITSIKEMVIEEEVIRILQSVVIKRRQAEAMMIDFQADVETGRLIKEMSEISNSPAFFQIRYLKAVEKIINNGAENVVFLKTSLYNTGTEGQLQ